MEGGRSLFSATRLHASLSSIKYGVRGALGTLIRMWRFCYALVVHWKVYYCCILLKRLLIWLGRSQENYIIFFYISFSSLLYNIINYVNRIEWTNQWVVQFEQQLCLVLEAVTVSSFSKLICFYVILSFFSLWVVTDPLCGGWQRCLWCRCGTTSV
jgi:hypothetical protein